jgi:uncharacterized protein (DUF1800 family)
VPTSAVEPDSPAATGRVGNADSSTGDRRSALKAGAIALAGLLAPSLARAQGGLRKPPGSNTPRPSLPPASIAPDMLDPTAAWVAPELRLVRRITMGLSDAEATVAKQVGYDAYLERQLDPTALDDSLVDQFMATNYPMISQGTVDTLFNQDSGTLQTQLSNAMIYRSAFSSRQLQERLVEFWTDHFNISFDKVGYLKVVDDRDVIRQYAMTSFPQLLKASAHSVAMLAYLDQTTSRSSAPNQNYAREIMELHTLSVNGGYTQTDVAELSRVLTGWTTTGRGNFAFSPSIHDFGAKTVLTMNIPASSPSVGAAAQAEGEAILNMLVSHPSTATFISTKMLKRFLRYDPTDAQIAAVAAVYTSTQGDIKAMLRAILSRDNLLTAPAKSKRPYHLVVSGVRALNAQVTNPTNLLAQIINAGQQPFTWQTPDGFPDKVEYWSGNILPRWNYANFIASANTASSVLFNVAPFMTSSTAAGVVSSIDRYMFGGEMTQRLRDELTTYVAVSPTNAARVRETVSLALSCSTFQYY